jgi:hypothetical protein
LNQQPTAPQGGKTQTYGKPPTDVEPNDVNGPALNNGALPSNDAVPQNGAQKTNDRQPKLVDPGDRTAVSRPQGQRVSTAFVAVGTGPGTTGAVSAGRSQVRGASSDAAGWRAARH